jgi:hypothetical protein
MSGTPEQFFPIAQRIIAALQRPGARQMVDAIHDEAM